MYDIKKILFSLALILIFLRGCTDNPVSINSVPENTDFQIQYGETVNLKGADLLITFSDVVEDSRCPEGLRCFIQGTAKVKLYLSLGFEHKTDTVQTYLPDKVVNVGKENNLFLFHVKKLEPHPRLNQIINKSDYRLTLNITAAVYDFKN